MVRRAGCVVLILLAVVVAGGLVTWIVRGRALQDRVYCQDHLRELAQFGAAFAAAQAKKEPVPVDAVPPGTVVLPGVPPESRLSWVVPLLPGFNQKRQDTSAVLAAIDAGKPWEAGANQAAARAVLRALACPANVPAVPPGEPAPTMYVGVAGLGADAATLPLGPPVPPRAGSFRYDTPTPFAAFADGTSYTLLFLETNRDPGPWLRGGPGTVRGLLDAPPLLGMGSQFGGNHGGGANAAMADGGVRLFTERTAPAVLRALATIAGGPDEVGGGE